MCPLVVHKDLLDNMDGVRRSGLYDDVLLKALLIGGSYRSSSRVWMSMGMEGTLDHYILIPAAGTCNEALKNPLYTPTEIFADLMGDMTDVPDDSVWPRLEKQCTFTERSKLEDTLSQQRHQTSFGVALPDAWLPSNTTYGRQSRGG